MSSEGKMGVGHHRPEHREQSCDLLPQLPNRSPHLKVAAADTTLLQALKNLEDAVWTGAAMTLGHM